MSSGKAALILVMIMLASMAFVSMQSDDTPVEPESILGLLGHIGMVKGRVDSLDAHYELMKIEVDSLSSIMRHHFTGHMDCGDRVWEIQCRVDSLEVK